MFSLLLSLLALPVTSDDLVALEEQHRARLFAALAPAVVLLANGKGFGSGFFVREDGLILTNRHVVAGAAEVQVVLHSGERLHGRVLERAAEVDLALVQVVRTGVPVLPFAEVSGLAVGAFVASVGHGRGAVWTFNTGMVSNVYPDEHGEPVFQTQIPLNPGNSGGPIVDRRGRVVGVVTAGMSDSNSINFGIKIDVAVRTFAALEARCDCLVVTTPGEEAVFLDGVMAGTGPRLLLSPKPGRHELFAVVEGRLEKTLVDFPRQRRAALATR